MYKKSKQHLNGVHEGYFEHQIFAFRYALGCFEAGFMALIHGCVPALFETAASDKVKKLASMKRPEQH